MPLVWKVGPRLSSDDLDGIGSATLSRDSWFYRAYRPGVKTTSRWPIFAFDTYTHAVSYLRSMDMHEFLKVRQRWRIWTASTPQVKEAPGRVPSLKYTQFWREWWAHYEYGTPHLSMWQDADAHVMTPVGTIWCCYELTLLHLVDPWPAYYFDGCRNCRRVGFHLRETSQSPLPLEAIREEFADLCAGVPQDPAHSSSLFVRFSQAWEARRRLEFSRLAFEEAEDKRPWAAALEHGGHQR